MPKEKLIINFKSVKLHVVIPKELLGDLINEFGERFKSKDEMEGVEFIAVVDKYQTVNDTTVNVELSVPHKEEDELREFLESFSENHKLIFTDHE